MFLSGDAINLSIKLCTDCVIGWLVCGGTILFGAILDVSSFFEERNAKIIEINMTSTINTTVPIAIWNIFLFFVSVLGHTPNMQSCFLSSHYN